MYQHWGKQHQQSLLQFVGQPQPVACSLPGTVGPLAGELTHTRRAEGANGALWPASSAALPLARSSGTCHCSGQGLGMLSPVSLLSCYASVTLRHELKTWTYLSSSLLLVSSSNTPWVTWVCCVCSHTHLCESKATSQMHIRYFVYKRYPGKHSQMPYHRPSKGSQAAFVSHSLSGNRFAFHSKVLTGEKRESCSLCF